MMVEDLRARARESAAYMPTAEAHKLARCWNFFEVKSASSTRSSFDEEQEARSVVQVVAVRDEAAVASVEASGARSHAEPQIDYT